MPFDVNKLYATEILAILLQNSDGEYLSLKVIVRRNKASRL